VSKSQQSGKNQKLKDDQDAKLKAIRAKLYADYEEKEVQEIKKAPLVKKTD